MKPILFPANETEFTTNGLGRLSDAIRCNVTEAINGIYELELVYPVEGVHFSELKEGRIIYSAHDDTGNPQPFEIYRISRPLNRKVTVNASHISYRLNKMVLMPFTAQGLQTVLMNLVSKSVEDHGFTFASDKTNAGSFSLEVPTAVRTAMGGTSGSIIDVYGGEWEFDHFNCMLRNRRGQDSGVNIRYGKNLTDINKTTDITNLWTGIVPYWTGTDDSNDQKTVSYNGVIWSSYRNSCPYDMVIAVDATSDFEAEPTQAQLLSWGQTYVSNNAKTEIPLSVNISFIQLWQTEEYKNVAPLQRLRIGDTVSIFYEDLGVDNNARITKYNYNVLLERYDSMTVGEVRANLATAVSQDVERAVKDLPSKTFMELALEKATRLITGGLGGHVVINTNEAGQPNEILIMNTDNKETATRVMRFNYQGIAFGTGYNGPFNSTWTSLDGTFNAQYINVINLTAAAITTGILKDQQNTNFWNMDTGEFQLAAATTIGGKTAATIASDAVNAQTQQSIFNKLTNNGQTQGIYLSNGKLYINGTYIQSGAITIKKNNVETFYADTSTGVVRIKADAFSLSSGETLASTLASAKDYADDAVDGYDNALTQQKIFNRLTNNGQTQGIYLSNGKLYINGTYIKTGTISVEKNNVETFYVNVDTGVVRIKADSFSLSSGETLASTLASAKSYADSAADDAVDDYDALLNQQKIFNKLTNNGVTQGIYLSSNKLYINADYIQSGTMSASRIYGGTLTAGGANNANGVISVKDANNTTVCTLNKDGIDAKGKVKSVTQAKYIPLGSSERYVDMEVGIRYGRLVFVADGSRRGTIGMPDSSSESTEYSFARPAPSEMPFTVSIPSSGAFHIIKRGDAEHPIFVVDGYDTTINNDTVLNGDLSVSGVGNRIDVNDGINISMQGSVYGNGNLSLRRASGVNSGANISTDGNITASGTKSRLANTQNYGKKLFYAYETATPYFGDIGIGETSEDGECVISIDDVITEAMRTDLNYCVFLQAEGNGSLYVAEKTVSYFIVKGTPNISFSWEVKARQTDFEYLRTESFEEENELPEDFTKFYENDLIDLIGVHERDLNISVLNLTKEVEDLYETA